MTYTQKNGVEIVAVPVSEFKILMVSEPKKTAYTKNYANAGYFGSYSENGSAFTLPSGHVICDYAGTNTYLKKYCTERGKFLGNEKFAFNSATWSYGNSLYGKSLSNLVVENGKASIQEITNIESKMGSADYLITGIPVIRNGAQVSWTSFAKPQGWTGGELYATYHVLIGLKSSSADTIYIMGWKSTTGNLVSSGEGYKKFKAMGFTELIKMDGGGSYMMNINGTKKCTSENRRINTIFVFDGSSSSSGGSSSGGGSSGGSSSSGGWTSGTYPVPTRALTKGCTGTDVKWMQTQLNKAGFKLTVDGSFGNASLYALKCYQASKNLDVDGSCGPATRASLVNVTTAVNPYTMPSRPFSTGSTGENVYWMQFQLNKYGSDTVDLDGSFGPAATAALKEFQRASGLEVDGWCGPATREKLKKY